MRWFLIAAAVLFLAACTTKFTADKIDVQTSAQNDAVSTVPPTFEPIEVRADRWDVFNRRFYA